MGRFKLNSKFKPSGDQPGAIKALVEGMDNGLAGQILMGVTGSGKTYTMANVIEQTQRPTLVIAHNKTLAAQLCSEFKEFFPDSAVEYFVSYYDYYQPEAYLPSSDTYIEKDSSINDEIDKMRHSATASLLERRDVIVVASVSCIYGLGHPDEYRRMSISLRPGMFRDRDEILKKLVDIQYERNDINFIRGTFRVRGDVIEIFPASYGSKAIRVEFFGDEIEKITEIEVLTGKALAKLNHTIIFPASHYATSKEKIEDAIIEIEEDMEKQVKFFEEDNKLIEAQRIRQRTEFDIEMMREIGFCSGIENYSRYFDGRVPGQPSYSLIDYFDDDYLLMIDESHVTIPQVRAMYAGDRSRKESLVKYGFRLPAAFDNRPLQFDEFVGKMGQTVYLSATPGPYEKGETDEVVEQIIRPTGLIDPPIEIRKIEGQIDDLVGEIRQVTADGYRTLVTTLTKKMAENLTDYLSELDIKVRYLHSDIDTLERIEIIRSLRLGEFDVLVGINLLREGLDLPEVALVAILDADKEGFLRSETAFIQVIGRAARNIDGHVIMYADKMTGSMQRAIGETNRRREIQTAYNVKNNIVPKSINKAISIDLDVTMDINDAPTLEKLVLKRNNQKKATTSDILSVLEDEMNRASYELNFERAALLRDKIAEIRERG